MNYPRILFWGALLFFAGKAPCQTAQWAVFESDPFANQMLQFEQDIWVHSIHGLVKVNIDSGQKTVYNTLNSGLNNYRNTGIGIDASGKLWVASELDGLFTRTPDDSWETISTAYSDTLFVQGPPAIGVNGQAFLLTRLLNSKVYLLHWTNQQMQILSLPPGFNGLAAGNIVSDKSGGVWFAMTKDFNSNGYHLLHWQQGVWEVFSPLQFDANIETGFNIPWIAAAPDGSVFIQTYTNFTQSSIKNKVFRIKDSQIQFYQMPFLSLFENFGACNGLAIDKDSRPWVAGTDHRIYRYNAFDDWTVFNLDNLGIPSTGGDTRFLLDAQNSIWVLGTNDLYKTDGQQQATVTNLIQSDIADFNCWGLTTAPDGKIWFGGGNGPSYFDGHQWTLVPAPWGSEYHDVAHPKTDLNGNLWYLPLGGSFLTRTDGQQFVTKELLHPDGNSPYNYRTDLDIDTAGNKWVCTGEAELLRINGNQVKYYTAPGEDPISKVAIDSSGKVWAIGRQIYQLQNDMLVLKFNANFQSDLNEVNDAIFQGNKLILSDWKGNIYRYNGISLAKDSSLLIYVPTLQNALYPNLAADSKGNLWAATYDGLFQKTVQGTWLEISTRTSSIIDNFVSQITTDACDNVWLWAYDALMVYNPDGIGGNCVVLGTHHEPDLAPLKCWPNPATSQVNISASENTVLKSVQVFAENGVCVLIIRPQHASTLEIPVQGLATGWYTAMATDAAGKVYQARFLVSR